MYVDGARLASAICSKDSDLNLKSMAKLVDVFYIGGTKNDALFGEAIVISNKKLQDNFRFYLKQKGALLAKGRVLGVQFLELFKTGLYWQLAEHANKMSLKLANEIEKLNYKFLIKPVSNQIFPIFPNKVIEKLKKDYGFYVWQKINDENSSIRLVTSWATEEYAIDGFIKDLKAVSKST